MGLGGSIAMVARRAEAGVSPTSPGGGAVLRPARVLLADDHPPMLDRISALLACDFVVVGSVTDGDQLVDAVVALRPDVLVVDISMPGVSGLEAAARVRRAGWTLPIVCLTAHEELDYLQAAQAAGALGYVTKSSMAIELVSAVRAALDGRGYVSASMQRATA